ncbi:CCR4-NOT transcription complex subunit 11 [Dimargaris verticillata]|uniref:CCR4-NOT transcription complex subunit 11 n=1 Tax=Dimargaris verticillata TaxID=2761393 RepID=A0A9W8E8I9_9FUNG|nr:CCR4-NOT transcription complex subunit 11 [Dimargaris verticillata]
MVPPRITVDDAFEKQHRDQYSLATFKAESDIPGIFIDPIFIRCSFDTALAEIAGLTTKNAPKASLEELRAYTVEAQSDRLIFKKCEAITAAFAEERVCFDDLNVGPSKFICMLVHNSQLIKDLVQYLPASKQWPRYRDGILCGRISLDVFEMLIWLVTHKHLTADDLHGFVTLSIDSCQRAAPYGLHHHQTRLLCLFIQALLQRHLIQAEDYLIEVSSFCLEFAQIKEATTLYRFLLTLTNSEPQTTGESKGPG